MSTGERSCPQTDPEENDPAPGSPARARVNDPEEFGVPQVS
jgi:hypothetical protein